MFSEYSALGIVHKILKMHIKPGDFCIDATSGNGHDSVYLCELCGENGHVLAMDIQPEAVESTQTNLAEHGFSVYLADTRALRDYDTEPYRFPAALVAGSERYGISRDWYDGNENMIKIPMRGVSDSLNVGVAASIFLYEMSQRLHAE